MVVFGRSPVITCSHRFLAAVKAACWEGEPLPRNTSVILKLETLAEPVALKVTGLPVRPEAVAVMVLVPAAVSRVQLPTVATPSLAEFWTRPPAEPLPAVIAKVTATPETALLSRSATLTEGLVPTGWPLSEVWLVALLASSRAAAPAFRVMSPDVTPTRNPEVNSSCRSPTCPAMVRLLKVAWPLASVATTVVPLSVPPPCSAAVMLIPAVSTGSPLTSTTWTTTLPPRAVRLVAPTGGWVRMSMAAAMPGSRPEPPLSPLLQATTKLPPIATRSGNCQNVDRARGAAPASIGLVSICRACS